jgi:glycerol kinase
MINRRYILSLDQGTSSCRALLFNEERQLVGISQQEFTQFFPQPGWVEHDANEIWEVQLKVAKEVIALNGVKATEVACIGITNQRETTVLWDRHSGEPVCNAIVWQDRRTAGTCEELKSAGHEPLFRERTGLVLDAYFSGTKIKWILDHVPGARSRAEKGDLLAGTIDSWLVWKLTGGRIHVTDVSNASRTLLFDIHQLQWDETLCHLLDVPARMLPEVKASAGFFGRSVASLLGSEIPITGIAGDQQAALFGQGCHTEGMVKNTYGTGCFLLMNTGEKAVHSSHGLITTIAWQVEGKTVYALEGSVFVAGSAIQWLRDGLGIIHDAGESEKMASELTDNGGVYFVPAFAGLGAPWWDMHARGIITGLTRGATRSHLVRAALEAMAYQTRDVTSAMEADSGITIALLRADGRATSNAWLMQFQADILGVPVQVPDMAESTAWGAALLAGVGSGLWTLDALIHSEKGAITSHPRMDECGRDLLYEQWRRTVSRAQT